MRQHLTDTPSTLPPPMRPPFLDDPASWDAIQTAQRPPGILAAIPARLTDPVAQARRAYLMMCSDQYATMMEGAALMEEVSYTVPGRGLHLMVLAQMGRHEEVRASGYQRTGLTPLECEDACHAHAALAVSCRAMGRHMEAYGHVMISLEHARALNMQDRAQYLDLLRLQVLGMTRHPSPDEAGALLKRGMPATRRAFGLRGHADSLMALGDYRAALRALGPAATDDRETAGMRAYLTLACGLPLLAPPADDTEWGRVAILLQQLLTGQKAGEAVDVQYHFEPIASYARALQALHLTLDHGHDRYALRTLGTAPDRPDQRAVWEGVRWIIDHRAGRTGSLVQHVRAIEDACSELRCPRALLSLLAALQPNLYVLLCNTPAKIDGLGEQLHRIPVLTGDDVVMGTQRFNVPGRSGRVMVSDALGIPDDTLDRSDRKRFRDRMREVGINQEPVNLGGIIRQLHGAGAGMDPVEAEEWAANFRSTMGQLTPSVHKLLHHYPL